ncbi:MAG: hypothetical protein ABIL09_26875 [Gemmatimonadota bacterium]
MRPAWKWLAATLLALAAGAGAQEERAIDNAAGVGVRAMGMGGAYLAVAEGLSAIYWNPAGLAQSAAGEVHVDFVRQSLSNDATLGTTRSSADLSNTRFGSLGVVFPFPVYRGSLVMAAGIHRIKDFDWALRTSGFLPADSLQADDTFTHEGGVNLASVAGAVDVSPSVSLGLSLSFLTGEDRSASEFVSTDTQDYFLERRFLDRESFLDEYDNGVTATFGVLVRAPRDRPKLRLGATATTGATHLVRYTFRAPPADRFTLVEYDDGTVQQNASQTWRDTYRISLPLEFGVGAAYSPVPDLLLAASAHLAEWSQTEYDGRDDFGLRANAAFDTQYHDAVRYHLGAEWQVPAVALDLRLGFYTDPLPFAGPRDPDLLPDPVTNPVVLVKQDRRYWTAGAGLLVDEAVRIELAWNRGTYERVEGTGSSGLREAVTTHRAFLGMTYAF